MAEIFPDVGVHASDPLSDTVLLSQKAVLAEIRFTIPIYRYRGGPVAAFLPGLLGALDIDYVAAEKARAKGTTVSPRAQAWSSAGRSHRPPKR